MSKPFAFRLQPVLDLREREERRAQEQLAEVMAIRDQGRRMLDAAQQLRAQAIEAERASLAAPATSLDLEMREHWRLHLGRHELTAGRQLEEAEREVALSRGSLTAAHQRRSTLEQLREKRAGEHAREAARVEANEIDEIGQRLHHARRRSGA